MEANSDISDPMYYWLYASSGRIKRTGVGAFGIYLAAIVGLVIKPFPEPVVLLIAVAASMVVVGNLSDGAFKTTAVLSGYSSGTTWLVFSAFTLSAAFVTTGLGKRIAYLLIGKIGNTTLGLGYVTVFLDLVLAPATPSNTARAGGIVLPIINSVAVALGSEPEKVRVVSDIT